MTNIGRDAATLAADQLKVFAQPQRLMILSALIDCELSVGAIEATVGITQPALSQQLAELRRADLVAQRREAKTIRYRLADDRTTAIVRFVDAVFGRGGDPLLVSQTLDLPVSTAHTSQSAARFAVIER